MKALKNKIIAWLLSRCGDLIYTSKGNLPVKDLNREVKWLFSETGICMQEIYTYNGEIVKQGADVYQLPLGTTLRIEQGNL
jgi:hypothetical protein